jgi:hypothetical protein
MPRPKKVPSEDLPVKSVQAYLRIITAIRAQWTDRTKLTSRGDEKALWYRGQGDASWELTPSRWRKEYAEENEAEMRLEFESVGRQLVPSDSQRDKWGWYFLMRHYGAPSRLLDWTINPLVALYFAVKSSEPGVDAAVWVIDPWKWNRVHILGLYGPALPGWEETESYLWDLEDAMDTKNTDVRRKWPIAIEPPHVDRRISAQEGRFILFGTARDLIASPNVNRKTRKGKHARLDKIVIPSNRASAIRDELDRLSVNDKTLFPDLGGLGEYIAWKWESF